MNQIDDFREFGISDLLRTKDVRNIGGYPGRAWIKRSQTAYTGLIICKVAEAVT